MTIARARSAVLALCLSVVAACGGAPSNLDICYAACEGLRRCGLRTDEQAANCRTDCTNNRGALSDEDAREDRECANSGAIRSAKYSCWTGECNKGVTCLQSVPQCIKR